MTETVMGPSTRTVEIFDNMVTGEMGIGFPAQAIYQQRLKVKQVFVQNSPSSAVSVFVGNIHGQYFELTAGSHIIIRISDLNKVYARTAGGNAMVNWLAMT